METFLAAVSTVVTPVFEAESNNTFNKFILLFFSSAVLTTVRASASSWRETWQENVYGSI